MGESSAGPSRSVKWWVGLERQLPLGLVLLALLLVAGLVLRGCLRGEPHAELRLGAGHPGDEAFGVALALAEVMERHAPDEPVVVVETDGTVDNLARLSSRTVDLATVQADAELPADARLVAILYADVFMLVVPAESPIRWPEDLPGARIAVAAPGSAQHASLDRLLRHYELASEVTLVVVDDAEADRRLAAGEVDALFRVRSVYNADLQSLVRSVPVRLVPIDHAAALAAADPALQVTQLPAGSLRGRPSVPQEPLSTLAVNRLLVAHADVPDDAVRAVVRQLFERRQALVQRSAVAAGIRPPERRVGQLAPLHRGLIAWLDRAEPSYLEANADFVSLLMSTLLLMGSWLWAGRTFVSRRMQKRADNHNRVLVEVLRAIDDAPDLDGVIVQKRRLLKILEDVLDDVETEAITPAHFQGFALGWEAAHDALRDRERDLRG